jgi:hypothetical protein
MGTVFILQLKDLMALIKILEFYLCVIFVIFLGECIVINSTH